jgi:uncharacterized protein (DUF1697 family)
LDRYIVLLRGINVGGNNIISMPELKRLLSENGFRNVITYINSGNIIFSRDDGDEESYKAELEALIAEHFGLSVPVVVISAGALRDALEHAPPFWDQDGSAKQNTVFVIPPASAEDVFREVGTLRPEYEQADYYGRVIFWSAPLATFSRTRFSKIVGSKMYGSITIRNANTVRKLLRLAEETAD